MELSMYQKGEHKKDIILKNAKELFYKKGYNKTTIKEIAQVSGDPVSLIHYYFQKKEDIIQTVYSDFYNNIDLFIYSKFLDRDIDQNTFLAHTINNRIYYDIILKDTCNTRVYAEILKDSSNSRLIAKYANNIYRKYVEEFNVVISEDTLKAYIAINFGARREFYTDYFKGNINISIQEGVSIIMGLFPKMLKVEQTIVDSILEQSIEMYQQLDYSKIKFLA